jgi:peptidyl-prolyl cis-trans isomerase B (cyclophilin B)
MEVVDKITAVEKDPGNRPLQNISMTVTVEEMPKRKIEKLYGYEYP